MDTAVLRVPGMTCDGCVASVTKALQGMVGVQTVDVDLDTKRVTVEYDASRTRPATLATQLADVGWEAEVSA